ncbi:hypothetical protein V8D89_012342 [Ganoderma adspersum]
MHPQPLLITHFHKPDPPNPHRKNERNSTRSQLRSGFNGQLVSVTCWSKAKLWYGVEEYAHNVVDGLGYKFNDSWPSDIPFRDLNRIPGGTPTLKRLLSLWLTGQLRFVEATEEDRCSARLNPWLVFPNAAERAAALAIPRPPSNEPVEHTADSPPHLQRTAPPSPPTTGLVLHPSTMLPQYTFPVVPPLMGAQHATGMPSASNVRPPGQAQRNDINKSRKRPVTNPEGRELRRPKRGPLTARHVVEADGIAPGEVEHAIKKRRILLTDEILTDCTEIGREASGSRYRVQNGKPEA